MARVNPNISPHSLRHSFATLALGKGVPLHFVQAAMAHSNPATTMYYNRDAENPENHPTFLVCDLLFGEEPPTAPAIATSVSAPIPLPAVPISDKPAKRSPRRQAARPEPSQSSVQSPVSAESLALDPLDDRLEEARRFTEWRAEQKEGES